MQRCSERKKKDIGWAIVFSDAVEINYDNNVSIKNLRMFNKVNYLGAIV